MECLCRVGSESFWTLGAVEEDGMFVNGGVAACAGIGEAKTAMEMALPTS